MKSEVDTELVIGGTEYWVRAKLEVPFGWCLEFLKRRIGSRWCSIRIEALSEAEVDKIWQEVDRAARAE